jgi:cell shape-determining protein MreD
MVPEPRSLCGGAGRRSMNATTPRPGTPEYLGPAGGPREPATASPSLRRIGRATLIAATISALANVTLATALRIGLGIDPVFRPLSPAGVAVLTFAFTCIGGVVFAVIARRWPTDAVRRFTIVAIVVLIVSLAAPLSLLGATQAQSPGVSTTAVLALIPLHVVAAIVLVVTIQRSLPSGSRPALR